MSAVVIEVEQRRFSRIPLSRPATVETAGGRIGCEVIDLSLRGARLRVADHPELDAGTMCALAIHLGAGPAVIRARGAVLYRRGDVLGVRCDRIDLDSLAHLRRMVELNLGDDRLVLSELMALATS